MLFLSITYVALSRPVRRLLLKQERGIKEWNGESRNGTGNGRARLGGDKNQQAERECEGIN